MRTPLPFLQVASNDPVVVLRILQEQQAALTVEHNVAQDQLRAAQVKFEASALAGGREESRAALSQAAMQEEDARRRLNMVRDRLLDAQRDAGIAQVATGTAIGQERWRIFGLKPAEFYSMLGFVLWFPVMLAFSRRIWRGPSRSKSGPSLEGSPQIARLEQAVEAIAIEVERISEAQRFSAKLLAERPVEAKAEQASPPLRSRRPVITPLP